MGRLGKNKEAEKILRPLLEKDPKSIELRRYMALVLSEQDHPDKKREAIQIYKQLKVEIPEISIVLDSFINELNQDLE